MQLVAYGAQDIYLTGNPQITFFKVVYRRHTNFSMESIQQTINGTGKIGSSAQNGTVTISRNGDLVYKVYVTANDTAVTDGSKIISEVELEIGGQKIDKHYAEWNDVWNELSTSESKAIGLKAMQCAIGTRNDTGLGLIQIPLNFWFCRNPGLALPLIALQYHEVKLKFTWGLSGEVGAEPTCDVWCDYIYLDTDERRRFAQVSHEYLIEQLQQQTATAETTNKLNFNHPVKELVWVTAAANDYGTARLVLNGHDRFANQEEEYFQLRQPFDYHTAVPAQNLPSAAQLSSNFVSRGEPLGADLTGIPADTSGAVADPGATEYYFSAMDFVEAGNANTHSAPDTMNVGNVATTAFIALNDTTNTAFPAAGASVAGSLYELKFTGVTTNVVTGTQPIIVQAVTKTPVTNASTGAGDLTNGNVTLVIFDRQVFKGTPDGAVLSEVRQLSLDTNIVSQARTSKLLKKINVYSFALKPEEHQPSGTCNFSRIDNAQLVTHSNLAVEDNIYAVNYNVLRIMSGMGGLAYSN